MFVKLGNLFHVLCNGLKNVQYYFGMTVWSYIVKEFTKQWNAYLRLDSLWKRVYCCYNNASMWAIFPSKGILIED
jgi:hypothetical protein